MGALSIRPPQEGDRETVAWIVASTGTLTPDDADFALALLDKAMNGLENETGVLAFILEDGGVPTGFVCFGPTPRTEGTWALEWIAVEPGGQGLGYGRHMLAYAESEARVRGGRLMLAEAPPLPESREGKPTFFERTGYRVAARIPGYFRPGVDKVIYIKELEP